VFQGEPGAIPPKVSSLHGVPGEPAPVDSLEELPLVEPRREDQDMTDGDLGLQEEGEEEFEEGEEEEMVDESTEEL